MVPSPVPAPRHAQRAAPLRMGLFDSIKKGFENEAQSTPAPNAGLKNVRMIELDWIGLDWTGSDWTGWIEGVCGWGYGVMASIGSTD